MSLHSKLLAAQVAVQAAEKSARNEHHSFNYATADSVSALAKEALNVAGLALVNTAWSIDPASLTIKGAFLLCDSESEERLELTSELPYVPGKGRPEDKAALASLTEMRGYLAIGLLGIERIEPLDVSGRDDTARDEPRREAAPKQQEQRREQRSGDDLGSCKDCGDEMRMGRNGKPYCHRCYIAWKEGKDRQPAGNGRDY
jgi:hypothetical protein